MSPDSRGIWPEPPHEAPRSGLLVAAIPALLFFALGAAWCAAAQTFNGYRGADGVCRVPPPPHYGANCYAPVPAPTATPTQPPPPVPTAVSTPIPPTPTPIVFGPTPTVPPYNDGLEELTFTATIYIRSLQKTHTPDGRLRRVGKLVYVHVCDAKDEGGCGSSDQPYALVKQSIPAP